MLEENGVNDNNDQTKMTVSILKCVKNKNSM